jgi:GT2 family glycosyltransferase
MIADGIVPISNVKPSGNNSPSVSVILPVWNGERYLSAAIESVIRQTHADFELLIVDDGSTDRSREIAGEFARREPRIVLIDREHSGLVPALNAALALARGQYVARMDADDISMPSRLEKQVGYLDAHESCVAVGSHVEVIDDGGEKIGVRRYPAQHQAIVQALISGASASLAHPTVLMRKDALLAVGGYRAGRFPSEDLDLWLRLSRAGELANIPEMLLRYRRHAATVGVRERNRQSKTTAAIIDAARMERGLRPLKPWIFTSRRNAAAMYHFECARIALIAGNRGATFRHARASIYTDPSWWQPYAALTACAFPKRALDLVLKLYERFRIVRF